MSEGGRDTPLELDRYRVAARIDTVCRIAPPRDTIASCACIYRVAACLDTVRHIASHRDTIIPYVPHRTAPHRASVTIHSVVYWIRSYRITIM